MAEVEQRLVATPHGDARIHVRTAADPRLTLLLQHGANGSIVARDLVAVAQALPADGVTTILLQQPFAVAGKKVAPRPPVLDEDLAAIVPQLGLTTSLVLGGRSSGARVSCRMAGQVGAVAALGLAFPLHPPGSPEKSRAEELLGSGVPTLVVQGARDPFGGPDEFPELPVTTRMVEVPDADHGFRVRASAALGQVAVIDLIVGAVRDWLATIS